MANPYKAQAENSRSAKAGYIGKAGNLDLKTMRAAGENNSKKLYSSSTSSMQHKDQSAASGMKRGGHVGRPKHAKPKVAIAVEPANPPLPDPTMVAAGAGSSPAPAPTAPAGPMPPMKRGGKVGVVGVVGKEARGGAIGGGLPVPGKGKGARIGGGDSGVGRLEKRKMVKGDLKPIM